VLFPTYWKKVKFLQVWNRHSAGSHLYTQFQIAYPALRQALSPCIARSKLIFQKLENLERAAAKKKIISPLGAPRSKTYYIFGSCEVTRLFSVCQDFFSAFIRVQNTAKQ